jgi:hypothetical protein
MIKKFVEETEDDEAICRRNQEMKQKWSRNLLKNPRDEVKMIKKFVEEPNGWSNNDQEICWRTPRDEA